MDVVYQLVGFTLLLIILVVAKRAHPPQPGKDWLTTEGVIYIATWDTSTDVDGIQRAEPQIKCLYRVSQRFYIVNIDSSDYQRTTQREWENVARYYPSGYKSLVHYDQKRPKRAIVDLLEPILKFQKVEKKGVPRYKCVV